MKAGMKVKVNQVRSLAGRTLEVISTLKALGLGKIGQEREHVINPCIWGMLQKVRHLVRVSEVK
jgi:large subunit ribosomal protein L30